jgi:hypothetical protein
VADKIAWAPGAEARAVEYLDNELTEALRTRDALVSTWIRWLTQYRPSSGRGRTSFPFEGAPDFVLPLTAIDVDQLVASFVQSIHAPENLWTTKALNERWVDVAKPVQDALQWTDANILKMAEVNERAFLEMTKLGTCIYKTGWHYEKRPVWTYDDAGRAVKGDLLRSVPFVDHIPLADFVVPPYAYNIQSDQQAGAPWVAERLRIPRDKFLAMAGTVSPFLPAIDKQTAEFIVHFEEQGPPEVDEHIQRSEYDRRTILRPLDFDTDDTPADTSGGQGASTRYIREIELWEIHARVATRSAVDLDDVILWYHQPTRRIVRAVYNYFHHGARPYDVIRYFPGDGFYGIGVCEQKEVFQTMASDLFNFNWANVLLANSRMVVAKAGANISPGEPFYPNKVWITDDDVGKSFGVFPMADIYPSLPQLQGMIQTLGERRTGIGDLQLGNMQTLPSRTPATTSLALMQEGKRRPDLTVKAIRRTLGTVGLRTLQNMQQFLTRPTPAGPDSQYLLQVLMSSLGAPEGQLFGGTLSLPTENAEFGLGVSLTATSMSANKETERQGYLGLIQLAASLYPQFLQAAQFAMQGAGTPVGDIALQSMMGLQELFKRTLEQYDIRNPEEILPLDDQAPQQLEMAGLQQQAAAALGGGQPGAVPAGPGQAPSGGAPALDQFSQLAELLGGARTPA